MRSLKSLFAVVVVSMFVVSCAPDNMRYTMKRYTLNFEGAYWDALVDSNPNGDNILGGTIARKWYDENTDLVGEVTEPYPGYWEGIALSNHYSKDFESNGTEQSQLVAYVDAPSSGRNFIVCNSFLGTPAELRFESKTSFIESMMVANTTYSYNSTKNGYRMARPLAENESIWIEAKGYINGSDEVQATAKFYLYKSGQPAFEGWQKWYMTSMCEIDKIVFSIEWDGEGYNNYPAYFAIDDIVTVRKVLK